MTETLLGPEKLVLQQQISLYKELLECLETEWQALIHSQEDAILALAARKEQILGNLVALSADQEVVFSTGQEEASQESLVHLKRRVAASQGRNYQLITATLETIQDFLRHLQSGAPGVYHAAGKVETAPGNSFFHRQV